MPLRFSYCPEKVVQAIAFFASNDLPCLSKLKVHKLLYFADKAHLLKYGRPIIGDEYFCLPLGPLPSNADNLLDEAEMSPDLQPSPDSLFAEYLEVDRQPTYPEYRAKKACNLDVFSESELEVLEQVVGKYGSHHPLALARLTHCEPDWQIANRDRAPHGRANMPYELFFEGQPEEVRRVLEWAEADQEDRDFSYAFVAAAREALSPTRRAG